MDRKCKCLTCNHITEMEKLIPDKTLRNKVLTVTDDLYEAMANESLTLGVEIFNLKTKLIQCQNKCTELKGDIARGNTKLKAENDRLRLAYIPKIRSINGVLTKKDQPK